MTDYPRRLDYLPLSTILPAVRNSKRHDLPALQAAMETFGFTTPLELDERTGRLVAGHGRTETLVEAKLAGLPAPEGIFVDESGEWLVPVVRGWASRDDVAADGYNITSNRLTEAGGWDRRLLAEVLEDVATADPTLLDAMAFTADDLDQILRGVDVEQLGGDYRDLDRPLAAGPAPAGQTVGAPPPRGRDHDPDIGDGPPARPAGAGIDPRPASVCCPACGHRFPAAT